ncbi:MAG: hypothetical protein JSR82_12895 [Verrucomicrobia bacterium]|nr:hypothetical protein [Verrucomicrobiota bacterium]
MGFSHRSASISAQLLRLLGWLPVVATVVAVWIFAVDVPTHDDWDTPGATLEAWRKGELTPAHFFAQHNESRFAVPRLIMLAGAVLSGGFHPVPWMFVSCGLMALTVWALRRWAWEARQEAGALLALVGALLFCVPTQTENLTWGGQIGLFVPGLALVLAHGVARQPWTPGRRYLLCAVLAWLATFSFANGMIVWVLGCPAWFAWWRRERPLLGRAFVLYAVVGVLTIAAYFHGYVKPGAHPSLLTGLQQPGRLLLYFLTWLGGPWAMGVHRPIVLAPVLGGATLVGVAVALRSVWLRRRNLPAVVHLWLVLLAYGAACGVVTSLGRCGFEMPTALAPRYTTFALWLPLATLGLLFACQSTWARPWLGGLCGLLLLAWPSGWYSLNNRRLALEQDRVTMRLAAAIPENPLLTRLHPDREPTTRRIRFFSAEGWLPPLVDATTLDLLSTQASEAPAGALDGVPGVGGGALVGWAMNPDTRRPATYVVIFTEANGHWHPWSAARVGNYRPDVAKAKGAPALARAGFEVRLPTWPAGRWKALAVDEAAGKAFLLPAPR